MKKPYFGRVSAPHYWMDGNFVHKVAGVFKRQGVYQGQTDCHWERDEGGLWAVIRVAITDDGNCQPANRPYNFGAFEALKK